MRLDDREPRELWDPTGKFIVCSSHGARYQPSDGLCVSGPCLLLLVARQSSDVNMSVPLAVCVGIVIGRFGLWTILKTFCMAITAATF